MYKSDYYLKEKMNRAANGEKLVIGFLGGSITQGTGASLHDNCYAHRVYKWWENNFPHTEFEYINAGIGGTDSKFGVARVEKDLLNYNPDVVVVEFAVNDVDNSDCLETAEGLVRKILNHNKDIAIIILCNIIYDSGATRQAEYEMISEKYNIPLISVRDNFYQDIKEGRISQREITLDNIHPTDRGHELIAGLVIECLDDNIYAVDNTKKVTRLSYETITDNRYEKSIRLDNRNLSPTLIGFVKDCSSQTDIRDCFKNGWEAGEKGDRIGFKSEFTGITVQYRRTVAGPAPKVCIKVDGEVQTVVDGKFDEDWGDKLELCTINKSFVREQHKVELEVIEADDNSVPFYLVSLILIYN